MSSSAPPPLGRDALARIPGVLGAISQQRAMDYQDRVAHDHLSAHTNAPRSAFQAALAGHAKLRRVPAVIAEVKRASPSQGAIANHQPLPTARVYAEAGAAAISVLTEPHRFNGALEHLHAVSHAIRTPTLRKDFVVHPAMVEEARSAGASAVLLMVSVLHHALPDYLAYAWGLGLEALVEVHDQTELELALDAGATCIGVNNRDLVTLEIDLSVAPSLIESGRERAPECVFVAESGYTDGLSIAPLVGLADAVLVGTALMANTHPGEALSRLLLEAHSHAKE